MLEVARMTGGAPLRGEVRAAGAKNAALPLMAAALLTSSEVILRGVPDLSDVRFMAEILRHLGAEASSPEPGTWRIRAGEVSHRTPYELVRKMRASVCLLGALVGRLGRAEMAVPGGCVIGPRPIDLHLRGLEALGCRVGLESGVVSVDASAARGAEVDTGGPMGSTVLGTANLVMAASLTRGTTRILNATMEPEVTDLCDLLRRMGAAIAGDGTSVIEVTGADSLGGADHAIIADRIEAGTYLAAGAITGGDVTVLGAEAGHLAAFLGRMEAAGVGIEVGRGYVRAAGRPLRGVDVVTEPHPGFPTDLQAQFMALMARAEGVSVITEKVYPERFIHASELQRLGARIRREGPSAIIEGTEELQGAPVMASDLRASASLVLAGLVARGDTNVHRVYHIDRGYEKIEKKLQCVGADIERIHETNSRAAEVSEN